MATKYIVVFDLDGTLCNIDHRLKYIDPGDIADPDNGVKKDWDAFNAACPQDAAYEELVMLANAMRSYGCTVVFITGRDDRYRRETWEWLCNNGLNFGELFMRSHGDYRQDAVVKMELAAKECGFGNILFAVEDRDRVVAAWRENGVTCLQCRPGAY